MNKAINEPYYTHEGSIVIHGDSLEELKKLPDNSVDAVVTDPPYGLGNTSAANVADCLKAWANGDEWQPKGSGFMGKAWDAWVPPPALWSEVYRVLKHGGHALVFAGSRTQDLMSISMRLAGFELRDVLMWLYSSGFPKSHNISKSLDGVLGKQSYQPATEEAKAWQGWGTALKPAYEPIILARKPLAGTVANNVLTHGVGVLNIDGCRIETNRELGRANNIDNGMFSVGNGLNKQALRKEQGLEPQGLWPANILLDNALQDPLIKRYFYCAKPSKAEREAGLDEFDQVLSGVYRGRIDGSLGERISIRANIHPTVKPIALMRYLCRLITPKGGTILEPFAGSGTTLIASHLEGFKHIGIEREEDYVKIIRARLRHWAGVRDSSETQKTSNQRQLSLFS